MSEDQALQLIELLTTQNDILSHIYVAFLYILGVGVPFIISVLLYKLIKNFI